MSFATLTLNGNTRRKFRCALSQLASLLILTFGRAPGVSGASAVGFEVSGFFHMVQFIPAGAPVTNMQHVFRTYFDTSNAFIHMQPSNFDNPGEYVQFATRGGNGFQMRHFGNRVSPKSLNDSTLVIRPTRFLGSAQLPLSPLWLVYASYLELSERESRLVPPLFPLLESGALRSSDLMLRAEWTMDESPPHLIKTFTDFWDAQFLERVPTEPIPKKYLTGQTNSTLHILSWTNLAGQHIPTGCVLNCEPGRTVMTKYYVRATNVIIRTLFRSFVPQVTSKTLVVDYRFAQKPNRVPSYYPKTGVVLETSREAWEADRARNDEIARRANDAGLK